MKKRDLTSKFLQLSTHYNALFTEKSNTKPSRAVQNMKLKCYIYFHVIICIFRERHLDTLAGLPMIRNISENLFFFTLCSVWKGELSRAQVLEDTSNRSNIQAKPFSDLRDRKSKGKKKPTNSGMLVIYVVNLLFDAVV